MYMWRAHNMINERIAYKPAEASWDNDPAFPKSQWPNAKLCPECSSTPAEGGKPRYNEDQVYKFLHRFYGQVDKDGAPRFRQQRTPRAPRAPQAQQRRARAGGEEARFQSLLTELNALPGLHPQSASLSHQQRRRLLDADGLRQGQGADQRAGQGTGQGIGDTPVASATASTSGKKGGKAVGGGSIFDRYWHAYGDTIRQEQQTAEKAAQDELAKQDRLWEQQAQAARVHGGSGGAAAGSSQTKKKVVSGDRRSSSGKSSGSSVEAGRATVTSSVAGSAAGSAGAVLNGDERPSVAEAEEEKGVDDMNYFIPEGRRERGAEGWERLAVDVLVNVMIITLVLSLRAWWQYSSSLREATRERVLCVAMAVCGARAAANVRARWKEGDDVDITLAVRTARLESYGRRH